MGQVLKLQGAVPRTAPRSAQQKRPDMCGASLLLSDCQVCGFTWFRRQGLRLDDSAKGTGTVTV